MVLDRLAWRLRRDNQITIARRPSNVAIADLSRAGLLTPSAVPPIEIAGSIGAIQ
jgi:hypothetical protein